VIPQQGPDAGKAKQIEVPVVPLPPKAQPQGQQK
jgi:hypothetical protein